MKKNFITGSFFLFLLFFFCFNYSFSQLNQWTWIRGDSAINNLGIQGIANIPSVLNDPSARYGACSWRDTDNNFWFFGGVSVYPNDFIASDNQLWKYNPSTNEWTFITPTSGSSGPMARLSPISWADHAGNLWLFGGYGANTGSNLPGWQNDLWKFNISSNTWTFVKGANLPDQPGAYGLQAIPSIINHPGGRSNAVSWVDNDNNLWLFGGMGFGSSNISGKLNDLWRYDISTNTWTWMKGSGVVNAYASYGIKNVPSQSNIPGARVSSMNWKDESGNLWLLGGLGHITSVSGLLNDLWKYDIATNEWVWVNGNNVQDVVPGYGTMGVASPLNKPGSMLNAVSWVDYSGNFWLFGGRGLAESGYGELNALWKYNVATDQWTFVKGNNAVNVAGVYGTQNVPAETNKPGARDGAIGWTDNIGNLWLFGGVSDLSSSTEFHNDLWKFTLNLVVPVKLVSFTGKLKDENTFLNWSVENETSLDRYEIERSTDGVTFKKAGDVKARNTKEYDYTENIPAPEGNIIYYRLRMIDFDGKFSYSNIIKLHVPLNVKFNIYPNPANTYSMLTFNKDIRGEINVQITDVTGKIIFKNNYSLENGELFISTGKFAEGIYPVMVVYKGGRFIQNLVIIR